MNNKSYAIKGKPVVINVLCDINQGTLNKITTHIVITMVHKIHFLGRKYATKDPAKITPAAKKFIMPNNNPYSIIPGFIKKAIHVSICNIATDR